VVFQCMDFRQSLAIASQNALNFVYADPPYVPVDTQSFTKYTKYGFDMESHRTLFAMLHALKCPFIMSNADVQMVRNSFETYTIQTLNVPRRINAKNPSSKINEVLVFGIPNRCIPE